jgi:hypothetical protein
MPHFRCADAGDLVRGRPARGHWRSAGSLWRCADCYRPKKDTRSVLSLHLSSEDGSIVFLLQLAEQDIVHALCYIPVRLDEVMFFQLVSFVAV